MKVLDVNVILSAMRRESPMFEQADAWLSAAVTGQEAIGILDETLAAVMRISTNPRVLTVPSTAKQALRYCEAIRSQPAVERIVPGRRSWRLFSQYVTGMGLTGNEVPDAWIAAVASDLGATLVTYDRGFARFGGLDVLILS